MMHSLTFTVARSFLGVIALASIPTLALAQAETFTAVASTKSAAGVSANAPLTVVVERFATDAEREALVSAVKTGSTQAARAWLQKRKDVGTLQIGARRVPIKYAHGRSTSAGRLITIATAEPIVFVGAGVPGAKGTAGYELGLVLLDVAASGPGRGEISPAAKVRVDQQGAIVTEDFNAADVVHLSNVVKK